jgi:hypothetical protein
LRAKLLRVKEFEDFLNATMNCLNMRWGTYPGPAACPYELHRTNKDLLESKNAIKSPSTDPAATIVPNSRTRTRAPIGRISRYCALIMSELDLPEK